MRIFRQKKAQAAMEFLMTYGWALLVVLIVIAALAFFGLLNPQKFLSDRATLGKGLQITTMAMDESGMALLVFNGAGKNIKNFAITVDECNDAAGASSTAVDIPQGKTELVTISCSDGIVNSKFSSILNYSYETRTAGEDLSHGGKGDLILSVGAGSTLAVGAVTTVVWDTSMGTDDITASFGLRRVMGGGPFINANIDMDMGYFCSEGWWQGPTGSEWALGACGSSPSSLPFNTWYGVTTNTCCGMGSCNRQGIMTGTTYCLHITAEDVYYDMTINSWQRGPMWGEMGTVSYTRTGPYT